MMDMNEKYDYWLSCAVYDMETAEAMLKSGRWFYVVYTCEQAIEKLVKGLYTLYVDDNVPKVHNITKLVRCFENSLKGPVKPEFIQLFDNLTGLYLSSRYPDFTNNVSSAVDKTIAEGIFEKTKEAFKWLQTLKP
jgi:HEPN domain-containing protein